MRNSEARILANALASDVRAWPKADLERRWSAAALRSALRAGEVARILPSIFAATVHAESFAVRAHAAHLWCGADSVVIGAGAASVWDLGDVPRTVLIAAPYGVKRACPAWLQIRRLAVPVPRSDWGACPIAIPAWAAVTAFASASARSRDGYLYRVVQSRLALPSDLLTAAEAIPRLPGRRHLEGVVAAIGAGSESHLETVGLRRVFNTSDFAAFIRQHWVRTPGGNYRLDMFHPSARTAVELDGAGTHGLPENRQRDINRDANVARIGILTVRLSSADLIQRAAWCRAVVLDVVSARS